jgi:hypothetical protein
MKLTSPARLLEDALNIFGARGSELGVGTTGGVPLPAFVNVNALAALAAWPSEFRTVTSTTPLGSAGATACNCVGFTIWTEEAAMSPNCTCAPLLKLFPVTVTLVPPSVGPLLGDTPAIVGGASATMFTDNSEEDEDAFASSTFAVMEKLPAVEGTPVIVPVEVFS